MNLLRSALVRPLEPPFQTILDDLARAHGFANSSEPARLGALVRKLSDAYNDATRPPPRTDEALAARLAFSFPRDVPKGAGAVRELVATGALRMPEEGRALRLLDVGAGVGATSRGVARALAASGATGRIEIDALDTDDAALGLAAAIARTRRAEGDLTLELRTLRGAAAPTSPAGAYDLIVLGQVLSELDAGRGAGDRVERHASLVRGYAAALRPDGAIVLVEPALRERTRHLHAVRDALVAKPEAGLHVFAPCVHNEPCPMLPAGDAWCHEDVDVDLPAWLVPVAQAAGLRWQGLTFSYLVVRRDGRRLLAPSELTRATRVVSSPVVTKGKRELFLCGPVDGAAGYPRVKAMRLDRHRTPANAAWDDAARGDVLTVTPLPPALRPRVEATTAVERVSPGSRQTGARKPA